MHNWLVHRLAWGRPWEGADQHHMNNDHDETSSDHDDKMIILRIKLMVMMTPRLLPSWSRRWRWRTRPGGGVSSCAVLHCIVVASQWPLSPPPSSPWLPPDRGTTTRTWTSSPTETRALLQSSQVRWKWFLASTFLKVIWCYLYRLMNAKNCYFIKLVIQQWYILTYWSIVFEYL